MHHCRAQKKAHSHLRMTKTTAAAAAHCGSPEETQRRSELDTLAVALLLDLDLVFHLQRREKVISHPPYLRLAPIVLNSITTVVRICPDLLCFSSTCSRSRSRRRCRRLSFRSARLFFAASSTSFLLATAAAACSSSERLAFAASSSLRFLAAAACSSSAFFAAAAAAAIDRRLFSTTADICL